jgi:DNA repair exonuclease SbcCD ATPase subunit
MYLPRVVAVLMAGALVSVQPALSQDSQSLGDAARQARLQKQELQKQEKDRKDKSAAAKSGDAQAAKPAKRVVTNDEIPEHVGSTLTSASKPAKPAPSYSPSSYGSQRAPAEQWQAIILAQKNAVGNLQHAVESLTESIRYPESCVVDCAQRYAEQRNREQQLESMQAQLEQQQKRLEDLQESARKQGFGSAVYDP